LKQAFYPKAKRQRLVIGKDLCRSFSNRKITSLELLLRFGSSQNEGREKAINSNSVSEQGMKK